MISDLRIMTKGGARGQNLVCLKAYIESLLFELLIPFWADFLSVMSVLMIYDPGKR